MRNRRMRTRTLGAALAVAGLLIVVAGVMLTWLRFGTVAASNGIYALGAQFVATASPSLSFLPTPTLAGKGAEPALFDTRVRIQNVKAIPRSPLPELAYSVRDSSIQGADYYRSLLYIDNPVTGKTMQLGDDAGGALLNATYPGQVLWSYICDPCPSRTQGLYLFDVASSNISLISSNNTFADTPKMDGNWVIFPQETARYSVRSFPVATLRAYDLTSHKEVVLTTGLYFPFGGDPGTYAIGGNLAVWAEWNTPNYPTLLMHDFASGATSSVPLKGVAGQVVNLAVNDGVITWWGDGSWHGFDLITSSHFSIPATSAAREDWPYDSLVGYTPVEVNGTQMTWGLRSPDNVWHYYTGEIVRDLSTQIP